MKLRKMRIVPIVKLFENRFDAIDSCSLIQHAFVKWTATSDKIRKIWRGFADMKSFSPDSRQKHFWGHVTAFEWKTDNRKFKVITLIIQIIHKSTIFYFYFNIQKGYIGVYFIFFFQQQLFWINLIVGSLKFPTIINST